MSCKFAVAARLLPTSLTYDSYFCSNCEHELQQLPSITQLQYLLSGVVELSTVYTVYITLLLIEDALGLPMVWHGLPMVWLCRNHGEHTQCRA